jgi:hypothetical protein
MLLYGSYKSSSVGIGLTIYCMSGILWDLGGIPWDPTHRGIYAASCMDICVGSQLDPKGSHMIPLKVALPSSHRDLMPTDDGATALEQQDVRTPCQDEFGGLANELKTAIQGSAATLKRAACKRAYS